MRRLFYTALPIFSLVAVAIFILHPTAAHAAFNSNNLIDDSIYNNTSSMNPTQINAWLNTYFPNSCISTNHGFSAPDPTGYSPSSGFTYGSNVSAGQVVYDAAVAYGLNPQVLLVTLQKEQSLVSGDAGCSVLGYTGAVGYGCPDSGPPGGYSYSGVNLYTINGNTVTAVSGTCVNTAAKAGFSQQLIHAAWLLKFGQQRSEGNTGWNVQLTNSPQPGDVWNNSDDPQTCYGGPMTQGSFKRCSTDSSPVPYDGYLTIDGSATHMDNGATAALYWYTPHFSGNQHFYSLFSQWFGDPISACSATSNVAGVASGFKILPFQYSATGAASLTFSILNNTGSACAEAHLWSAGYNSWAAHFASAMRASDPANGTFIAVGAPGNRQENLAYVVYSGGGGAVEVHKFSPDLQRFPGYYDVASNLSGVTASSGSFVSGNFLGHGYKQLAYILYSNGRGHAEIHMFDPSLTKAVGYYDVETNLTNVSSASGQFVAGDFFGRGYDQLAYVVYSGSSGTAEVHVFNPSLTSSTMYEVPTNLGTASATSGTFVAGDFFGRGYDQLAYVVYAGSSGRVEVHGFSADLRRGVGVQDIITNLTSFNINQ